MADEKARILKAPDLPTVVKGDGRYLMTLLRQFLTETAREVNLANGFTAEEIKSDGTSKVPDVKNFHLTFDRLGGVLEWDHTSKLDDLAYYEIRTNANVGSDVGLLERTRENTSTKLPLTYVGHVYCYTILKNKERSAGTVITYTKARPVAPTDLALTKDQQGTIVSFLAIPLDCIGANVYVNDEKYSVTDNLFLYTGGEVIKTVRVAYYDQFGEGESTTIYCEIPDVTNFIVERNDSQLYFYWDALPIHGVHYIVKVGAVPDWDRALTIFDTKDNKHRYIYPNVGDYYMLIKAVDEHNNYSKNAAYVYLTNRQDEHKNVIVELDQKAVAYGGTKVGMYYDAVGGQLKLDRDAGIGEYIIDVQLPQKYRARNWLDFACIGQTNDTLCFDDMAWLWDSEEAARTVWNGTVGDLNGVQVRQEIARYVGIADDAFVDVMQMDGGLTSTKGNSPSDSHAIDYALGRWHKGAMIGDTTRLAYAVNVPRTFTLSFNATAKNGLGDVLIATVAGDDGFLVLGYDAKDSCFFLRGSDGATVKTKPIAVPASGRDWYTIAVSQSDTERTLYAYSLEYGKTVSGSAMAAPIGTFSTIYLYPKL